jgi:hypothetical protein
VAKNQAMNVLCSDNKTAKIFWLLLIKTGDDGIKHRTSQLSRGFQRSLLHSDSRSRTPPPNQLNHTLMVTPRLSTKLMQGHNLPGQVSAEKKPDRNDFILPERVNRRRFSNIHGVDLKLAADRVHFSDPVHELVLRHG